MSESLASLQHELAPLARATHMPWPVFLVNLSASMSLLAGAESHVTVGFLEKFDVQYIADAVRGCILRWPYGRACDVRWRCN